MSRDDIYKLISETCLQGDKAHKAEAQTLADAHKAVAKARKSIAKAAKALAEADKALAKARTDDKAATTGETK